RIVAFRRLVPVSFGLFVAACGGSPTTPDRPRELSVTGPEVVLSGSLVTYIAWATLSDVFVLRGAPATWSTDNPEVASIDSRGILTGLGPGSVIVTAAWNGRSATATVRVS